jgi:hypothetical protein
MMTANVDMKALYAQAGLNLQPQAQHNHQLSWGNATTGGYVFTQPSTSLVPTMPYQQSYQQWSTIYSDPNAAKITALEDRINTLEARTKMLNDDLDAAIMRVKVLEEANAEMRAKGQAVIDQLEALLKDVRKRELAEDEERTCNSAGGILGRAISKHW